MPPWIIQGWTDYVCQKSYVADQTCLPYSKQEGLSMLAMQMKKGTRYACHISFFGDQICLPCQEYQGPGMLAMLIKNGTKHACHISFVRDQVCLPSFLIGTRYACHLLKISNQFPVKHDRFRSNWIGTQDSSFYCASFQPIRFDRK